jgi:hypothetical protein
MYPPGLDALSPESRELVERMELTLADARIIVDHLQHIIAAMSWPAPAWGDVADRGPPDVGAGGGGCW